ncbi:MAG: enoyl-CoA hydratase [Myxococcales bacterium]|nr:enoyl-CoA hydratase [Myxococcales bacterium]
MSEPVLLVERSDEVATLTLNRPRSMNALSRELREAIATAFSDLATDPAIRVVILTGAGRAFCAGLDLKELASSGTDATATFGGNDMIRAIAEFEGPILGAVNGFAVTGGFELALACDVLVASSEARFADTHARVGILPGWGLSQKLPRLIGIQRAKELSLTGNYLSAERAEAWGLVNRVVAPEELLPTCRALAVDMLGCVPEALRRYKRVIDAGFATTFSEGLALEGRASRDHAKSVTSEVLARRRGSVQERGRSQIRS